jgi:hypothetical protein
MRLQDAPKQDPVEAAVEIEDNWKGLVAVATFSELSRGSRMAMRWWP